MSNNIDPARVVPRYLFQVGGRRAGRRPYIPAALLYLIVAMLGCVVGLGSFYLMRSLGM